MSRPGTAEDDESEEEPEWELPEDMREWQGDHSDRKGKLLFRQAQQTARQVRFGLCHTAVGFRN